MKTPAGTTFVVAASLLGVAAVAQLVAILVYFGPGFTSARPAVAVVEPVPTPAAAEPAATLVPAVENEDLAAQKVRLEELMREVEMLEKGPSPDAAMVPLEEAAALQPRNPDVLARLASLHEKLGQIELAQETWKSVLELGPDAGRFLEVAEIRLRLLRPEAEASAGRALRDQVGLQPGSTLGVVDLTIKEAADQATKDLRLAVKARPGEAIDGRDVRINVTFYEMLDGEPVPTTSRVQSMWFTTPVDWKDEGIEILEVKYEVPRIAADGGPAPPYYGYMVSIYHRGQLQETRADPVDLQELFPPPLSESPDFGGAGDGGAPR